MTSPSERLRRDGDRYCITGLVLIGSALLVMSTWETQVAEPRLTVPLVAAGLGFGLVIPPIGVSALSVAPSHYWGAAASLVTASRMVGMALGLAALSAWGIERFYSLTAHVTVGTTYEETEAPLIEAGVIVFQNIFTIAGFLSLIAILPALLMSVEDAEAEALRPGLSPSDTPGQEDGSWQAGTD